ncbi:MAG: UDP-glucose--hexose-1-phosphate uridylyltransferase [Clostridiales bacterium]|nr:UDP-glucose--hexose-1-phosphate uridylyltransferase [Clostridiales bacterium]
MNTQAQCLENLLAFAKSHKLIEESDKIYCRNLIYDMLSLDAPDSFPEPDQGALARHASEILAPLLKEHAGTPVLEELLDAKIMGVLTPRPSEVIREFKANEKESPEKATSAFYEMSKANHYIQMDRIEKNLSWKTSTEYGDLEITVNLSKPEKDPRDIAASRNLVQKGYPKCLLCMENEGFAGNLNHPARQNLRLVPVELAGETWMLQYSPYVYYNEHCIVLSPEHVPMKISEKSFRRLLDFIERFPHYTIGSNSDIPVVGGSILSHDHFQGGRHVFPMAVAKSHSFFSHPAFPEAKISLLVWPLSVIRITMPSKDRLVELCVKILEDWISYSDPEADVIANVEGTRHNAITPIARREEDGTYTMDLVLRNNRASEEHPMGIFHPHQNLHHIKKENIGLIEVLGLAILPGRISQDMEAMASFLSSGSAGGYDLSVHQEWLDSVKERRGIVPKEQASEIVKEEIGLVFRQVLNDAGVFKHSGIGKAQFAKFMGYCGFLQI